MSRQGIAIVLRDPWAMWEASRDYVDQGWQVLEAGANPAHLSSLDKLMQTLGMNHVLTEPQFADRWPDHVTVHLIEPT